MKNRLSLLFALVLATVLSPSELRAVDWSRVVNLEGSWFFTVGDDPNWAKPQVKTDDWDKIQVPGPWEGFYPGYNGFAWYRREFDVSVIPGNGQLTLFLGRIDDVDEVFVNGVKVGQTGTFLPEFVSAYNIERKYPLQVGLLKPGRNTIAVRVYDQGLEGGIVGGSRIGIFYDNDQELVRFDLSGTWKFSIYRERDFFKPDFNDKEWADIQVPANWEAQGFNNHDGFGWYRKQFIVPATLVNQDLYIVLGRIDDTDRVYLNGKQIGRTESLPMYRESSKSNAWRLYRAYSIPKGLLQRNNVLAVEVHDKYGDGGIYEGPIGRAAPNDAKLLLERKVDVYQFDSFWSVIRYIFD
jgi:sialate O-acetylesterase